MADEQRDPVADEVVERPIRGAIRVRFSTSTATLVAGEEFSVFVRVENPFEVPLILQSVTSIIPSEIEDVERASTLEHQADLRAALAELVEEADENGVQLLGLDGIDLPAVGRRRLSLPNKFSMSAFGTGFSYENTAPTVAVARGTEQRAKQELEMTVSLPLLSTISQRVTRESVVQPAGESDPGKRDADEDVAPSRIEQQLTGKANRLIQKLSEEERAGVGETILQPGNSVVQAFRLRTRRTIRFRPAAYKLQIRVAYELEGIENTDVHEFDLKIRASLSSMMLGAAMGSLAGWVVRNASRSDWSWATLAEVIVTILTANMAVVVFARKSDVQQIVAIEDFWGGVASGFLLVYTGFAALDDAAGLLESAESD